jgi:hypothetical protein
VLPLNINFLLYRLQYEVTIVKIVDRILLIYLFNNSYQRQKNMARDKFELEYIIKTCNGCGLVFFNYRSIIRSESK